MINGHAGGWPGVYKLHERLITLPSKGVLLKVYKFPIDGHEDEYFRARDVRDIFQKPIYAEDVRKAAEIVKEEIKMRRIVFKNDKAKRDRKVKEMELILKLLSRCSDQFPELQKEMFG